MNALTPTKLVECPFEVRVDEVLHDRFYDVRDAVAVAKQVKGTNRSADVVVVDTRRSAKYNGCRPSSLPKRLGELSWRRRGLEKKNAQAAGDFSRVDSLPLGPCDGP